MNRLLLLGASALALSACDTINSSAALDADAIGLAAAGFTPTYSTGAEGPQNADIVYSDTSGDGLVGFMGFSDGVVRPVLIRIAEDESAAYVSIAGGPVLVFDTIEESGWSGPAGYFYTSVAGYGDNYAQTYGDGDWAEGVYGQQTAPGDLLTGTVNFAGGGGFNGADISGGFDMFLTMNFGTGGITGFLDGGYGGESGSGSFTSEVTGQMVGSFFAMSSDIDSLSAEGNLGFLGGFYNEGTTIGVGVAGTLNGTTVGGGFGGSVGGPGFLE